MQGRVIDQSQFEASKKWDSENNQRKYFIAWDPGCSQLIRESKFLLLVIYIFSVCSVVNIISKASEKNTCTGEWEMTWTLN